MTRAGYILLLYILTVFGSSCAPVEREMVPTLRPEPFYDKLYPYYVELCAVSQIRANFAEHGGSPGHAVMYLKGVCRDPVTLFPTLKLCDCDAVDLNDPESGTGISVNKMLKNVNWIAIPGKRLFLFGNLEPDEILSEEHARETILYAVSKGIFDGIQIHDKYKPGADEDEGWTQLAASETLGTDFALTFGRTVYCARLPVTVAIMEEIVDYLNGLNKEYALGEADYNWSGYYDNCSHTLHNALAAAGVWPFKSVNKTKLLQIFHLSVPANEFADLARLANQYPFENFRKVYKNKVMRKTLMEHDWLPSRHGALLKVISVHQNNELYDTRMRVFVLENPFLRPKSKKVREMFYNPGFTELEANLRYFKDRYQSILDRRPEGWDKVGPGNERVETRKHYYKYIENQLADVNDKLRWLTSPQQ